MTVQSGDGLGDFVAGLRELTRGTTAICGSKTRKTRRSVMYSMLRVS